MPQLQLTPYEEKYNPLTDSFRSHMNKCGAGHFSMAPGDFLLQENYARVHRRSQGILLLLHHQPDLFESKKDIKTKKGENVPDGGLITVHIKVNVIPNDKTDYWFYPSADVQRASWAVKVLKNLARDQDFSKFNMKVKQKILNEETQAKISKSLRAYTELVRRLFAFYVKNVENEIDEEKAVEISQDNWEYIRMMIMNEDKLIRK